MSVLFDVLTDLDGGLADHAHCAVAGCRREALFMATRRSWSAQTGGWLRVAVPYCADHYGQANRFQARVKL